jgi:tetratricopeptide (TPR) repeat protein
MHKYARRNKAAMVAAGLVLFLVVSLGGTVGWAVRDWAARQSALETEVDRLLDEAGVLMEQGKWHEALAGVKYVDTLLASAGRTERPPGLLNIQQELMMAQRLEGIYRAPERELISDWATPCKDGIDQRTKRQQHSELLSGREQDARFAMAFREFGIDIEALEPEESAARIGRTWISPALVHALDEWAAIRKRALGDTDAFWKKLVEIARQADLDRWRCHFRQAILLQDRPALEQLAESVPIREVPPATVYLLGHALKELGASDKAMAVLKEGQRRHPEDFWLNDALGWLSVDAIHPPRYNDALRYYTAALAARPQSVRAHRALADVLMQMNALDEAIAEYSRVTELNAELAAAGYRLPTPREWDFAAGVNFETTQLARENAAVLHSRGRAHGRLNEWDKAVADYSKAIELQPQNAAAWNNRADAYIQLHQYEKAIADFSKAIELAPKVGFPWTNRGLVYYRLGNWDNALHDLSKGLELEPDAASAQNYLAWFLATCPETRLRDPQRAVQLAGKAVRAEPENGKYRTTLGAALYRIGNYKGAAAALQAAEKLLQGAAGFNLWLGRALFFQAMTQQRLGNGKEAHQTYDRSLAWLETKRKALDEDPMLAVELRRFQAEVEGMLGPQKK